MDPAKLVQMANRIGEFFAAQPDRAEALEGVATHLCKFWAPPMRRQILEALDRGAATELSALVREALVLHRARLEP
ncbi:formate dehydrogenase subunit delta [Myxococcota bacterium]|nr:formate dehydrogenase subunit delta [Myxococcota bacterium]